MNADTDSDRRWLAFEAEAMPHVDRLFRHAMWLVRNRAEAEDLVQETLVQALQSFHRFTPGTNCRAWLVTILQHVRSNRLRKQGRVIIDSALEERVANVVPFVPPIPDRVTDEDMLLAMREIPAHHQEVILLCDVEEMTYKEIAAALDIPIGTVMSRLHRGRELLRTALARRGAGPAAMDQGSRAALMMECRDVRELADSFLSEQLLVETNHELLRHLETCPVCRAEMADRRALRDRLRAAFLHAEDLRPRPEFAAELRTTLACLAARDHEALGAAIVVDAGGGCRPGGRWRGVRAQLELADRAWPRWRARRPATIRTVPSNSRWPSGRLLSKTPGGGTARRTARSPRSSCRSADGPLELLERHACVYQGRRFGHVVFRYRGALTSLLVADATPPPAPELEPSDAGPAVASLPAGRFVGFVVADLDRQHVLRLAQALAQPLVAAPRLDDLSTRRR